jgi:hypothetical protein
MSGRSSSPDSQDSNNDDDDSIDEKAESPSLLPQKKIWSWLHVAVTTGNIHKVLSHSVSFFVQRSKL